MTVIAQPLVLNDVKAIVAETLKIPDGKLDIEAEFDSFGMDSIIAMELMTNLSKRLSISITPATFSEVTNVIELASAIEGIMRSASTNDDMDPVSQKKVEQPREIPFHTGKGIAKANTPVSRRSTRRHALTARERSDDTSSQRIIDFIKLKYSINFSGSGYGSIDEIVDALVTKHQEELYEYYRNFDSGIDDSQRNPGIKHKNSYFAHDGETSSGKTNGDIAIVGLSCRFPDAQDANIFWDNLLSRKNSIREIPKSRWDWSDFYSDSIKTGRTVSKWGALIDDVDCFDAEFFNITTEQANLMDPQERILLQEVYRAFQDAGISMDKASGSKAGVFVGYEYAEYEHYLRANASQRSGGFPFSSSSPTYYLANRLSYLFNFQGPSESINTNCASSAVAVHRAYYALLNEECDTAVAGGVCLNLFADDYIAGSQYGMLSPSGTCAVFDNGANGFTRGEGVGVVILKRLEDARRDNNRIYSVIKGCYQNNRGSARNISEIKHESITGVIEGCCEKASILPETINYIEVDGYATKWGDSFEFEGIKNVFRCSSITGKTCALGSVKGNIGHLEPASGIASVIKVALSMHKKCFPPTITKKNLNEFIDIDNSSHPLYIADKDIKFRDIRQGNQVPVRAGVNSFADSGVNVHILMEEHIDEGSKKYIDNVHRQEVFVLSAKSYDRLMEYVELFIGYLSGPGRSVPFSSISYSLQVGRAALNERLAIIASSSEELVDKLHLFMKSDPRSTEDRGIFYGSSVDLNANPLFGLITEEMTNRQIDTSLSSGNWEQVALLWSSGAKISWERIWTGKNIQYVSLPGYPFSKEKYWFGSNNREKSEDSDIVKRSRSLNSGSAISTKSSYMAPRNEIEIEIAYIWSELLELEFSSIGIHDDFLKLGGDSMKAMSLISKLNSRFSQSLPLDVLFTASTISELAKLVEGKDDAQLSEVIVPMQVKGDRSPIFSVPGFEGHMLALGALCSALGDQRPFYGLQAVGLDGKAKPLDTVEKIADANISVIEQKNGDDSFILLGYSNGGVVAYEMARKLLRQGKNLKSLILLDTPEPKQQAYDEATEVVRLFQHIENTYGSKFKFDSNKFKDLPSTKRGEYLYDIATSSGMEIDRNHFDTYYRIALASESCVRRYKTKRISKKLDVLLFKATENPVNLPQDYGWNEYLIKPIEVIDLNASHFSLVKAPHVEVIARMINERIK